LDDDEHRANPTRRQVLAAGAAAALVAMTGETSAAAGGSGPLERRRVTLGFIPLTDCAPLVIAKEQGFFARHGLEVTLSREPSWANIRDKVAVGALDGAHMLEAMPIAAALGIDPIAKPMTVGMSLDLNGNAVTLSHYVAERLGGLEPGAPLDPARFKALIDAERRAGRRRFVLASVFPYSSHNYLLRYWLASGGIDPDEDVRLVVVPPPQMVTQLAAGRIDGFCVGEPWNQRAETLGIGRVAVASHQIWSNHPEKVFAVASDWADRRPATHLALLRALIEACAWLDVPENRPLAARTLAQPHYVGVEEATLARSLTADRDGALPAMHVFYANAASFPWRSHAEWFATQMVRWRQVRDLAGARAAAERAYRPDLYRAAAAALGLAAPLADRKLEGAHPGPWQLDASGGPIAMGPDQFIDRRLFDPADLGGYLGGLPFAQSRRAREPSSALRA
jgi:nitrate/nitrite transport system substrate-binding protein